MSKVKHFRIPTGLSIDDVVLFIYGTGIPGNTTDTNTAPIGSVYVDTATGILYTKIASGDGPQCWGSSTAAGILLYSEAAGTYAPPSAQGSASVAIGSGAQTAIAASNSVAIGEQSLARLPGCMTFAAGRFQTSGDAQVGKYLLRTHTINNMPTECFIDGTNGSEQLVLPDDSTWSFEATVTAHRTDAPDGHAGFKLSGVVFRQNGASTVRLQGSVHKTIIGRSDAAWDINITTDPVHGALKVAATGESSKIIRWLVAIDTVEVTN